jgi:hypothetical protein
MRGRPRLFPNRHPLNVLISDEDYRALVTEAARVRRERPGFSVGDLVRGYIRDGMGAKRAAPTRIDSRTAHIRQLRAIARTALEVAKHLKKPA